MFGWTAKAKVFEYKAHKFTHASQRLNILANDILRYIDICDALASTARDTQIVQEQIGGVHAKFRASKDNKERAILHRQAKSLYVKLNHLHKSFRLKLKLLRDTHGTYEDHLKKFSKALK